MAHGHDHTHDAKSNIGLAFFLNLAFTIVEIVGGALSNSVAIQSDAVHDLGDSLSLAMAWFFQRLSKRGRNKRYTYGYKRFSLLGAVVNSIVLTVGSIYIISEAVPRLFAPEETNAKGMFLLAVLGIAVNGFAVLRTRRASSVNERVVSLHMLEDVLGWAAVLVGAAVIHFTGWSVIDPILSLGVACFVLLNVYKNIRRVLPILMEGVPSEMDQSEIAKVLKGVDGVAAVHDLHIWSLDETNNILTARIVLTEPVSVERAEEIREHMRTAMSERGIGHTTLELEIPGGKGDHCPLG